jgi:phosphatidylserine/phosphatidylglycerophosphate/cardiolipin synthase-like enzyme
VARKALTPWILGTLCALGCSQTSGGPEGADLAQGPAMQDQAPPKVGCAPLDPRAQAPEVFVGYAGLEMRLLGHISGAKKSLDILMYELSLPSFVDAVIQAHKRGVAVRVILDPDPQDNAATKKQFMDAGVPIRDAPARFQYAHAKALIVDGVEAVIMSANMDMFSVDRARNYGVVDRDPKDLADLQAIFNADWAGAADPDLSCTRLLVSPINAQDRLRQHIASAKTELRLEVMYVTERGLVEAVKERIQAGVPTRILMATPNFVSGNAQSAKDMLAAGAQVKYFGSLHAKLVVADGVAFIGSENLSFTSLTKNREVGLLVSEPEAARAVVAQFEKDWQSGFAVN